MATTCREKRPRYLRAGTTLWQLWGRKINNTEDFLLFFLFFYKKLHRAGRGALGKETTIINISKDRSISRRSRTTSQHTSVATTGKVNICGSKSCAQVSARPPAQCLMSAIEARFSSRLLHPETSGPSLLTFWYKLISWPCKHTPRSQRQVFILVMA